MSETPPLPQELSSAQVTRSDRARLGMTITALGFLVFIFGAKPEWFNLDRSPVIGFVQISVFTAGLGLICLGGYTGLASLWGGEEKTILADVGLRLIGTGYVIAVFAGMADVFGLGTQPLPGVPFFGPWQAVGVQIGQGLIAAGMLMLTPYHRLKKNGAAR
jgi:hypothetical protein